MVHPQRENLIKTNQQTEIRLRRSNPKRLQAHHQPISISLSHGRQQNRAPGGEIYLLGLVAEAAGLVGAGGLGEADDGRLLPVLLAAHALHEAHHV